jgi:hypothetical protein
MSIAGRLDPLRSLYCPVAPDIPPHEAMGSHALPDAKRNDNE